MNNNGTQLSFQTSLRQQARDKAAEYSRLLHEYKRMALQLERAKTYAEKLNGLLEAEGLPQIRLEDPSQQDNLLKRPGNRSKDMPLRKAQWEGYSLPQATAEILESVNGSLHADDLILRIYEIETDKDKQKAKHSYVSTLRQGVTKGLWRSLGKNVYEKKVVETQPALAER